MSLPIYPYRQTPSAQYRQWLMGVTGCIVRDLETLIVLVLLAFNYIPLKVTPRIHSDEVTVQGLSYRNSSAWGWHNSHQSGVVSIMNKLILQNGKKFRGVQKEQQRAQNTSLRHS